VTQRTVNLIRRQNDEFVDAGLYTGMKPEDILLVEREWQPIRSQIMQELLNASIERSRWPESLHWDWTLKSSQVKLLVAAGFGGRARETPNSQPQHSSQTARENVGKPKVGGEGLNRQRSISSTGGSPCICRFASQKPVGSSCVILPLDGSGYCPQPVPPQHAERLRFVSRQVFHAHSRGRTDVQAT